MDMPARGYHFLISQIFKTKGMQVYIYIFCSCSCCCALHEISMCSPHLPEWNLLCNKGKLAGRWELRKCVKKILLLNAMSNNLTSWLVIFSSIGV